VKSFLNQYCIKDYPQEMCDLTWNNILKLELNNAVTMLDPIVVCSELLLCDQPTIVIDSTSRYFARVLKDSPPALSPRVSNVSNTSKPLRFLVFADVHLEYDYQEVPNGMPIF
jgi:hypothetical protein